MAALTMSAAAVRPVVARASVARRSARAVQASKPALTSRVSVNAKFAAPAVKATKARGMTTTASALPIAEVAAIGPEIAEVAVTCFAITLVGLAIGFVLLRVEAAVEGEE